MSVPTTFKITATGQTVVGSASDHQSGEMILQVSGTFTGLGIVPKGLLRGGAVVASAPLNMAYTVVKTGVVTDGATTAISAGGLYKVAVPAGVLVVLDTTSLSTGSVVVDVIASPLA